MKKLSPDETEILGSWIDDKGRVKADENCGRISWLTENGLTKIAVSENGWDTLYQDPNDSRYWVLSYPNSHQHGGGPPALICIDPVYANEKFGANS